MSVHSPDQPASLLPASAATVYKTMMLNLETKCVLQCMSLRPCGRGGHRNMNTVKKLPLRTTPRPHSIALSTKSWPAASETKYERQQ